MKCRSLVVVVEVSPVGVLDAALDEDSEEQDVDELEPGSWFSVRTETGGG